MTPKVYKGADVCEIAELQPYVLRSWEKEFPWIGLQRSSEGPRLYRQVDLDQVLRIKQLVFGEGLTLAGARRKLESETPALATGGAPVQGELELELEKEARGRIRRVREGLRSLLNLLDGGDGRVIREVAPVPTPPRERAAAHRGKAPARAAARTAKPAPRAAAKRKRASA